MTDIFFNNSCSNPQETRLTCCKLQLRYIFSDKKKLRNSNFSVSDKDKLFLVSGIDSFCNFKTGTKSEYISFQGIPKRQADTSFIVMKTSTRIYFPVRICENSYSSIEERRTIME